MNAQDRPFNIKLSSEDDTIALGYALAKALCARDFVALNGDLGAGKTTLARAIINGFMGQNTEVPSPTFTLVQTYETHEFPIFHFDLYRIKSPDEIWELGWEDIGAGLTLVEWPERLGANLIDPRLEINLSFTEEGRFASFRVVNDMKQENNIGERLKGVINEFI